MFAHPASIRPSFDGPSSSVSRIANEPRAIEASETMAASAIELCKFHLYTRYQLLEARGGESLADGCVCSLPLSRSRGKKEAMQLRTIFINEGMSERRSTNRRTQLRLSSLSLYCGIHLSTALSSEWDPPAWHAARTVIGRLIRESGMATHGEMALAQGASEKVACSYVQPRNYLFQGVLSQ